MHNLRQAKTTVKLLVSQDHPLSSLFPRIIPKSETTNSKKSQINTVQNERTSADEERRRVEAHAREERKRRREEEAMAQRREREWRDYGAKIPKTPPPAEIRSRIGTPVSALGAPFP